MQTNNKIKLAVAGLRGVPGVMGGVETHCEELYKRMPENIDVLIYGRSNYSKTLQISNNLRVKALYSPKQQFIETPFHTLMAILHCFFFEKVDVFHIHGIGGAIFTPLARLLFPKVFVTHHSQNYEHKKWGYLARGVFRCGEKFALKYANKVLFVSKTLLNNSKSRYKKNASKFYFIANGFSLPKDESKITEITFPYFLAVGRLVPEKGLHDLVEAFNKHQGHEKLVIAGDSDFKSKYADSIKANANKNVLFIGKKTRSELKWLYSNCEAFIMPSYSEGLPISALEAISCSAPILLSNIVQNIDLGLPESNYYELGNLKELVSKLNSDINPVNKAILGKFNWEEIANKYIGLVEDEF